MRNRLKSLFPLIAVLLLLPWPIAYAYDSTAGDEGVKITVAESAKGPSGVVFGRTRGSVKPGDLFYVDATSTTGDVAATMEMTNASELAAFLGYLNLRVGVYRDDKGQWTKVKKTDGLPAPEPVITMQDAEVTLNLMGGAKYKITIDGGSFYCNIRNPKEVVASPRFNLTVK